MHFKLCTMHYMLGHCICPHQAHTEPFGFGGLSLCKKALQAIGECIPQEVNNLHACVFVCAMH